MQPSRKFDAVYDPTFSVSGARDHYREQSRSGGFSVERVRNFPNYFSEVPSHPSGGYKFVNRDKLPACVSRQFRPHVPSKADQNARSQPALVSGENRYKYFTKPLGATVQSTAMAAVRAMAEPPRAPAGPAEPPPGSMLDAGTQSLYRESEAQTVPWDAPYKVPSRDAMTTKQKYLADKHHTYEGAPELLTLKHLHVGHGLPAGLAEVEAIEKARVKRAFEASLPPLDDFDNLPLRHKLIEAWETAEWSERERELRGLQDERLAVLERAIKRREEEEEAIAAKRLEALRVARLRERQHKFVELQRSRVKHLRTTAAARSRELSMRQPIMRDVVGEYANYGSRVYAPVARSGHAPGTNPQPLAIDPRVLEPNTYGGVLELEASMQHTLLRDPVIAPPKNIGKMKGYAGRQHSKMVHQVEHVGEVLKASRADHGGERGHGQCWPMPVDNAKTGSTREGYHAHERPDTPTAPPKDPLAAKHAAATLLQRLLRGRAAQNTMYVGKEARLDLIRELQYEGADDSSSVYPLAGVAAVPLGLDAMVGEMAGEMLRMLAETDAGKKQELLKEENRRMLQEEEEDLGQAALKIQSVARGRAARKDVERKRETARLHRALDQRVDEVFLNVLEGLELDELISTTDPNEAKTAALRIQSIHRGRAARREVEAMRLKAKETRAEMMAQAEADAEAAAEALPDLAAITADEEQRIVKLQANARGYMARKQVKAQLAAKLEATGVNKEEAEEAADAAIEGDSSLPDLDSFGDDDIRNLTKLQARSRGYLARKQLKQKMALQMETDGVSAEDAKKAASELVDSTSEEALPDLSLMTEDDIKRLTKIQAASRGHIVRKQRKAELAAKFETSGATADAAKDIAEMAVEEGGEALPDLDSYSEADIKRLIKLQATGRGYLARKSAKAQVKEALLAEGASAEDAEAAAAAAVASDLPDLAAITSDEEQRIVKLQANARGYLSRKKTREDLAKKLEEVGMGAEEAEATAAAAVESGAELPNLESFSAEDVDKLTHIQANARGFLQRKKMKTQLAAQLEQEGVSAEEAAATAEQVVEGAGDAGGLPDLSSFGDEDIQKLVKLQAASRGHLQRKKGAAAKQTEEEEADPNLAQRRAMEAQLQAAGATAEEAKLAVMAGMAYGEAETQAAIKMQSAGRGMVARKEVKQMRSLKASYTSVEMGVELTEEQTASVVKMQAVTRGRQVRKQQERTRAIAARLEAEGMAAREAEREASKLVEELPAVEAGSADEEAAVLRIQAAARGRAARKNVANLKAAKEAKEALPAVEDYTEEQAKAAVRIQAVQRGKADRKRVLEKRLAQQLESEGVSKEDASAAAAAAVSSVSDGDALPDLADFSAENVEKLTKVQANARGFLARKALKERLAKDAESTGVDAKEAAAAVDAALAAAEAEGSIDLASFTGEDEMKIVKIQAAARGRLARAQSQKIRKELVADLVATGSTEEEAAAHLQDAVNEASAAGELPDLLSYSEDDVRKLVQIQAAARGRQARSQMKAKVASELQKEGLSAKEAEEAAAAAVEASDLPDLSSFDQGDIDKLTTIQANARGFLQRKKLKTQIASELQAEGLSAKDAAEAADAAVEESLVDLSTFSDSDVRNLTKVQANARGFLARKQLKAKVAADLQAKGATAEEAEEAAAAAVDATDLPDLSKMSEADIKSLTKVQAHARGHLARKNVKKKVADELQAEGMSAAEAQEAAEEVIARNEVDIDISQFSEDDVQRMIRIQAAGRGMLARKSVKKQIANELEASGLSHADADAAAEAAMRKELPDLESFSEADKVQIAKIQASARGYIVRKQMKEDMEKKLVEETGATAEEAKAAVEQSMDEIMANFSAEDEAKLVSVQARARGYLTRKKMSDGK